MAVIGSVALTYADWAKRLEEFDGKPITTFRGIPVRTVDAIVNNETNVV